MVFITKQRKDTFVTWYDGKIPSKSKIIKYLRSKTFVNENFQECSIKKYSLNKITDILNQDRSNIFINLVSAYIDSNIVRGYKKNYQIALFQPKWNRVNKAKDVLKAEKTRYKEWRHFIDDDEFLINNPPEDILHLKPWINNMADDQYFQCIAIYPNLKNTKLIEHENSGLFCFSSPLENLLASFNTSKNNREDYRNYTLFELEADSLMKELYFAHKDNNLIADNLTSRGFNVIQQKVKK